MTLADGIGLLGVSLVLLAYFLLQIGRIDSKRIPYSAINLAGSSLLMYSLLHTFNLASVVIEVCWIAISIVGLVRAVVRAR